MCNIEFPHFGASYPDAHCIDGYLWDMDSYENGCYTIGGDDPCPFCNTEAWLKTVLDNEEFASREEALEWVEKMREKWGAEHLASARKTSPNYLEEVAREYAFNNAEDGGEVSPRFLGFIAGAKWDREQIMEGAIEYEVGRHGEPIEITLDKYVQRARGIFPGEKVKIIIVKEEKDGTGRA